MKGYVHEFFSSIQGEGLWVGAFHHFIRFAGCSVGCSYCDTNDALDQRGSHQVTSLEAAHMAEELERKNPGAQAISITGGEPLEQKEFLISLCRELKQGALFKLPILLETAGLNPRAMEEAAPHVDMVSMDIKLFSTSGVKNSLKAHEKFIKALKGVDFYIKAVVNRDVSRDEWKQVISMISRETGKTVLFIQPETHAKGPLDQRILMDLWRIARRALPQVRVLPQIHPILNLK